MTAIEAHFNNCGLELEFCNTNFKTYLGMVVLLSLQLFSMISEVKVNGKVLEAFMRLTFEEKYRRSICNLGKCNLLSSTYPQWKQITKSRLKYLYNLQYT